jgi:hypothetical protein
MKKRKKNVMKELQVDRKDISYLILKNTVDINP